MIDIVLATNNEGKLKEYEDILDNPNIKLHLMKELNIQSDPDENGKTYEENALIKARAIKDKTNFYILADDSGVEFEALGEHFPGVHTHRFALENGGNEKLNPLLAKKFPNTKGTFFSAIALITPSKEEITFLGTVTGKIAKHPEGHNGFGYDNIFIIDGNEHTNAYYPEEIKNKTSHRAKSCQKLIEYLKSQNLI